MCAVCDVWEVVGTVLVKFMLCFVCLLWFVVMMTMF